MSVMYSAVERFDPASGEPWREFINWSGLTQLREVISLDDSLCPTVFSELTAEDWRHNVHDDYRVEFFYDLEYVLGRIAGRDRTNVLALMRNPTGEEVRAFGDRRFDFRGFDLTDLQLGISALLNCGGFPKAFSPADLSACGLLTDHSQALLVQRLLRAEYPGEYHADCDVWAVWLMMKAE